MRKRYYVILAVSMTIFSFVYSPIHSYAAGLAHQVTTDIVTNRLRSIVTVNSVVEGEFSDAGVSNSVSFDFSTTIRIGAVQNSNEGPWYLNGYFTSTTTYNFAFSAGVLSGGNNWSFSYDVDYGDSVDGMICLVTNVRPQSTGNNSLQIYITGFCDNAYLPTGAGNLSSITVTCHIQALQDDPNVVPSMTISAPTTSNSSTYLNLDTNPSPYTGFSRVINLATEKAIENAIGGDIDYLVSYLGSIYANLQTYFPSVLAQLQKHTELLGDIKEYLRLMYLNDLDYDAQFIVYLAEILDQLQKMETEGTEVGQEMQSEASSMQQEFQSMESQMQLEEPSIEAVWTDIDEHGSNENLFYYLDGDQSSNIIVKILILTFSLAMLGYILYGRL